MPPITHRSGAGRGGRGRGVAIPHAQEVKTALGDPLQWRGRRQKEYPSSFFRVEGKYREVKARHQGREQQQSFHTFIGKL